MLKGENIICFAKDWSEVPTSNNHVMRQLARNNVVLWLNSLAMRSPRLSSKRDLSKIVLKLRSLPQGAKQVEENLWVYTPVVLPLPYSELAAKLNRQILKTALTVLRRKLNMRRFQLWTFQPTSAPYVGMLGEDLSIYYCTDEFSKISYLDGERIPRMEKELLRKVDLVFTTARSLLESKKVDNPEIHHARHGVDQAHFAQALNDDKRIPDDLVALPGPRIGFFGLLHDWIDVDLIAYIARERPDWSIVLIGSVHTDITALEGLPNAHVLGRRKYEELPAYCRGLDLGIMPFVVNELTRHVNPIKLREYLSAGLPVVSTPLPEIVQDEDLCVVTETREEFLAACAVALAKDSREARMKRSQAMEKETWEQKVVELGDRVLEVKRRLGR
jgi:glycosyltransferase involved in cell wall biosynthesis